jgi:HlyD family secretion protein
MKQKSIKYYIKQVQKQTGILQRELRLAAKQFSRDSAMFRQGVISPSDFEKAESAYLQKRYALEEAGSQLTKARLQLADAEQQILDLQLQEVKEQSRLKNDLVEAASKLKGAISVWVQTYVIKAPIDGQVSFNKYWSVNQQ